MGNWLLGRRGRRKRTRSAAISASDLRARNRDQTPGRWQALSRCVLRLWGRLVRCRYRKHASNRRRARWREGFWHARCQYCGVTLRRLGKDAWVVDAGTE